MLPPTAAGRRLDQVLAELLPEFSRSRLQTWIADGQVTVNGAICQQQRTRVRGGEQIVVYPQLLPNAHAHQPQALPLAICFEDDHLLVLNKPAGLVVHPAAGNWDGTLLNALLHYAPQLALLPRGGIVHRLDKDTTGLLVVAKTLQAHTSLVIQLQQRTVKREYRALVVGELVSGGRIELPIGRHPTQRTKMAVVANGRPAVTNYRVLTRYRGHTLLAVQLQTGRTHQIRVHCAHLRHPIVGDPVYGLRPRPPVDATPQLVAALQQFPRQALHAIQLGLTHPITAQPLQWEIPLAADFAALLDHFAADVNAFASHVNPHVN
ncbi:23S rRNA pseudouridine(1911/1915/1917) synthase RluD [Thiospirillum jenense]|uniref:23S rRNA pseudouridine(1911/1915/1917) synthase RluD n=1 Tax=Thiospirillum jenense TaxID=1653858 RepID=UPI0030B8625F